MRETQHHYFQQEQAHFIQSGTRQMVFLDDFPEAIHSTNREHAKAHALWLLLRCVAVAVAVALRCGVLVLVLVLVLCGLVSWVELRGVCVCMMCACCVHGLCARCVCGLCGLCACVVLCMLWSSDGVQFLSRC